MTANDRRAKKAYAALSDYSPSSEGIHCAAVDLFTDMMHLIVKEGGRKKKHQADAEKDFSFTNILGLAGDHFLHENAGKPAARCKPPVTMLWIVEVYWSGPDYDTGDTEDGHTDAGVFLTFSDAEAYLLSEEAHIKYFTSFEPDGEDVEVSANILKYPAGKHRGVEPLEVHTYHWGASGWHLPNKTPSHAPQQQN